MGFDPNSEGIELGLEGFVKLQSMLAPEVEKFRTLRNDYRETCKPETKPEVSEETETQTEEVVTGVVEFIRTELLGNPEIALLLTDELKSLADDVKQVGKDFLASTGQVVEDGEGDETKLAEFLEQRDRVSQMFKLFDGMKSYVMSTVSIDEAKKAGLKLKKNTKANAKEEFITDNYNDPSKSADELGNAKAGRPSSTVQTFAYEYKINGKPVTGSRFEILLQASEGANSIYTWQDLHNAIKKAGQELGADSFKVTMSNGVVIEGTKVPVEKSDKGKQQLAKAIAEASVLS